MSKPFFSVAIPTWEINGKGVEYLHHSFTMLYYQTFKDFEVVVSDHSVNDDIKNLCESWEEYLDIRYYRNERGRGKISPNLNNAMHYCSGEYIKILFQDDFLYGENSLMMIKDAIVNSDKEVKWLVTGCSHTKDGENLYDQMVPRYNDKMYMGYNTISCPTVLTVKNDTDTLAFDEEYNWLCDVNYYHRCYLSFGLPTIVPDVCAINRDAEVRTTNMISEQQKNEEVYKMIEKYGKTT